MSDEGESQRRVLDGTTWSEFCDTLKAAGPIILGATSPDAILDRSEGWRYLSRLARGALESFVEASDPDAPEFKRTAHETIKLGMDNPDNIYLSANVDASREYAIRGTRGTVHYLGFGTQRGNYGATGSLDTTGYLEASGMELGPDRRFEIIVSTRPHPGNWLPMTAESRVVVVRQTRLDHANEVPAQLEIRRVDAPNRPRPLTPEQIDRGLRSSARFVRGAAKLFADWAQGFEKHVNELPRFDPEVATAAGGDPNIAYYHSYWRLSPDEALVIEATPPECDYWNFQLANHWLESLDYRYFPIHLNSRTAKLRRDGSVRVVVAHEDPGVDNWLQTCGHEHGTMCWRWIRAKEHPQPRTRVVKLAELRGD